MDTGTGMHSQQPATQGDSAELRACLEAPYDVRVREKAGRFSLSIVELGLLRHGKSLEAAYLELMQAKEQRVREYASEGLLAWLPKGDGGAGGGAGADQQPSLLKRLWPFFIKAAVVAVMLLWGVGLLNESMRNIGYGLEKKLDSLAHWSQEDVEKNRAKAAQIAAKLGPVLRELLVMFRDDTLPSGGKTAKDGADKQRNTAEQAGGQPGKK